VSTGRIRFLKRLRVLALSVTASALVAAAAPAGATGSAHIRHPDGTVSDYPNVRISIDSTSMTLTSSDGAGRVYIGKAGCTRIGALLKCLPYDATLDQDGTMTHIPIKSGDVWLNPTKTPATIPDTGRKLPPLGVVLTMDTKGGSSVLLSGTADEVQK
jgi:hypothetical protein